METQNAIGARAEAVTELAFAVTLDRRRPVADQIYGALKQAIVTLKLLPGTSISENRICRQVGVSRTPVREALIRLVADELIDVFPQQGSFVAPIKISTVKESHFIRKALEIAALRRVAETWARADSTRNRLILAQQDAALVAADNEAFHALDETFHRDFCRAAALEGVWSTIQEAKARVDRVHRLYAIEGRLPTALVEHRAIVDALDAGEAEQAVAHLDYHLDRALDLLDQLIGQYGRYFID